MPALWANTFSVSVSRCGALHVADPPLRRLVFEVLASPASPPLATCVGTETNRKGFLNVWQRDSLVKHGSGLQFDHGSIVEGAAQRTGRRGNGLMTTQSGSATPRAATLTDVARLAGVSIATASKAINGRDQVKAETRLRVLEAAERLSFAPNALARGLLKGRTGTVGLLTSDLEGRFSIPVLMGAEDAFGAGRVSVFLCDARGDAIREQHHVRALLSRRVDGLIVVGSRTDPRPPLSADVPVPVVYAYAPSEDPSDVSITADNVGAGRLAVEHLLSCGRRRVAHVSGDPGYKAAQDRAAGAEAAVAAAGLELVGGQTFFGSWSEGWGRGAARMIVEQHGDVDAFFCGSDQIARGVLDALRELGRDVPGEVSVIGFDNWEVLTTNARPQLTSVDMNLERLGRVAAQRLFAAIDGTVRPGVEELPCRVVTRASTVPIS